MKKRIRENRPDKIFNVFNYTLLSIAVVFLGYPLVYILSASLSEPSAIFNGQVWLWPVNPTFKLYKTVFSQSDVWLGYRNSIIYTIFGICTSILLSIMAAYPLSRKDFAGKKIIAGILTFTILFHAGLVPTFLVIRQLNLINKFWVMLFPGLYPLSVMYVFIMKTFFQTTIPDELEESAVIDGCSNIRIIISIILPLSKPIMAVMILFYGVGYWNSYFNAYIYLTSRELYPLQLFLREMLVVNNMTDMVGAGSNLEQQLLGEGLKYSVIIISSLPALVAYPLLQKYFIKGMMIGALKG